MWIAQKPYANPSKRPLNVIIITPLSDLPGCGLTKLDFVSLFYIRLYLHMILNWNKNFTAGKHCLLFFSTFLPVFRWSQTLFSPSSWLPNVLTTPTYRSLESTHQSWLYIWITWGVFKILKLRSHPDQRKPISRVGAGITACFWNLPGEGWGSVEVEDHCSKDSDLQYLCVLLGECDKNKPRPQPPQWASLLFLH